MCNNLMLVSQRLDKWLWAARFYKTRALATKEVNGGKIKLNGVRAKAARGVTPGDRIEINKISVVFTVVVQTLVAARGSAAKAAEMYEETRDSINQRQQRAEQSRFNNLISPRPHGRPNKHERRRLLQQKGKL